MTKLLFICTGNICRSPMAEFYMKDLVRRADVAGDFAIASAATSSEELGNPVYPPVLRLLNREGLDGSCKRARQISSADYDDYDLLIGMDEYNLVNMRRAFGGDPEDKLHLLLDYTGESRGIADPWYTRDFQAAWADIALGCRALLGRLTDSTVIDLKGAERREELFARIYDVIGGQSWYGHNLDALWDVLTGEPHRGERFLLALPREDDEVYAYALRIRDLFAEAGALCGG